MANETKTRSEITAAPSGSEVTRANDDSLLIDEFEIIELEDRLELAGRCNGRCAPDLA